MNNGQTYEMGYLALPDISASDAEALQTTLAGLVESAGGQVISHGDVHFIDLAYEMIKKVGSKNNRHSQAYFSWIKFNAPTCVVETIKNDAEKQKAMLRLMVVKTLADDSLTDLFEAEEAEEEVSEEVVATDEPLDDNVVAETEANSTVSSDDLTKIEGIGPVLASTLHEAGISTFADLATADTDAVNTAIAGVRGNHDAGTWAQQAALARDAKWDELKTLQDELDGGR